MHKLNITSLLLLSLIPSLCFSQSFFTQKADSPSSVVTPKPNVSQTSQSYSNEIKSPIIATPTNITNPQINPNTNICNNLNTNKPIPKFSLNFDSNDLQMDYSKRSKNLIPLSNRQHLSGFNLLGLFKGSLLYSIQPIYKTVEISPNKFCGFLYSATIDIKMNPIIYISKEVQQFQCSYNRILAHEKQHYRFETEGIKKSQPVILNTLKNEFPSVVYATSPENIKKEFSIKSDLIMKSISTTIIANTSPNHASIDTESNYALETKQCNVDENLSLNQSIKNPY